MSWGFFADLRVSIPTDEWAKIRARALKDVALPTGFLGLADAELESSFLRPHEGSETIGDALEPKPSSIHEIAESKGTTKVRICLLLDKSQLESARPLAAVLEAARAAGGTGSLRLVNDGTYSGEAGVELSLKKGKLSKKRLDDGEEIVESLAAELAEAKKPKKKSAKKTKAPAFVPPPAPVVARSVAELLAADTWTFDAGELELMSRPDLEQLAAAVPTATGWGRHNAIHAAFALDPKHSRERFAPFFRYVEGPFDEGADTSVSHIVLHILLSDLRNAASHGWYASDPRWEDLAVEIVHRQDHSYDVAWELLARANSERGLRAMFDAMPKLETFSGLFHVLILLPPKQALPVLRQELDKRKKTRDAHGLKSAIAFLESKA
jgi:hypothetical protein